MMSLDGKHQQQSWKFMKIPHENKEGNISGEQGKRLTQ